MASKFDRRQRLTGLLGTVFTGSFALRNIALGAPVVPRINVARLRRNLEELSVFGRPAGGTCADGVTRYANSDADVAGRTFVMGLMTDVGLDPRELTAWDDCANGADGMLRTVLRVDAA